MSGDKLKYQPSIYVARGVNESPKDFMNRVMADPRLLPDQRLSLELERHGFFEEFVCGIYLEQAPIRLPHRQGEKQA